MKKGAVALRTIVLQLCFLCLQLILLHSASAETAADRAKVASILFNGKATYQDYNVWGACPVDENGQNWCTIQKSGYVGGHSGIDIQTTTKSKEDTFYSVSTGVVIAAGTDTYKTLAVYDSSRNITVIYLHASAVNVGIGATISAIGIPLGKQGDSGASGKIHVHLEARSGKTTSSANGKPQTIDPIATALSYINAAAKPAAPTGLSASASGTSITLRWNDVSSNESGFRLYRWNGSSWTSLAATAANATSYTNSGLSSYTTYSYKVCAYNTAGESCSSSVSATTGSSGSVPGSVSVNPSSGSWTSNQNLAVTSAGATTIYYTMVNTYDGSTPSDPSSPSASSNNGSLSGSSATFQLYGSSGNLKRSKLRFVGCNSYGCGSVSGVYSYSIDQRGTTTSKPAAPGSVSATATSSSSINLRWSDLSSNESGFRPYRWNGSTWTLLGNLSANTTSYTNSGLSSNTTYYYYLCSYNSAGESCPANYVQATTSSTSSGSSWDGKSPSGTVCEQDATTVASQSNSYGKVELRWSNTCKTNWTRVVPNSSSYSTYGKIRRTSDGRSYTTSGTGTRFTAMVYAPTVQACASGTINGYSLSEVCR